MNRIMKTHTTVISLYDLKKLQQKNKCAQLHFTAQNASALTEPLLVFSNGSLMWRKPDVYLIKYPLCERTIGESGISVNHYLHPLCTKETQVQYV